MFLNGLNYCLVCPGYLFVFFRLKHPCFFPLMRRKITPQHKLFHPKPVLMLITHTAGCISCHPPPLACAVYFHSSVVHIGYCLWCMILKRDRLRRDRRQSRQLTEQANKQIQVIFCWRSETHTSLSTTKVHSFYIYATTEVSEILMTLGRN